MSFVHVHIGGYLHSNLPPVDGCDLSELAEPSLLRTRDAILISTLVGEILHAWVS